MSYFSCIPVSHHPLPFLCISLVSVLQSSGVAILDTYFANLTHFHGYNLFYTETVWIYIFTLPFFVLSLIASSVGLPWRVHWQLKLGLLEMNSPWILPAYPDSSPQQPISIWVITLGSFSKGEYFLKLSLHHLSDFTAPQCHFLCM